MTAKKCTSAHPPALRTPVIFRTYPDGEIIALFPEDAAVLQRPELCTCYAHIGQHSAADYDYMIRRSPPPPHGSLTPTSRRRCEPGAP